jgi:AraC-like DNA-binding protein
MIFNTDTYENSSFCAHFHRSYELIYVISGEFHLIIDGKNYTLRQGDFALALPYRIHSWKIDEGAAHICVFSEKYVKSFAKATEGKIGESPVFRVSPLTEEYYKKMLIEKFPKHHFNLPPPDNSMPIKSALYGVLYEYLEVINLKKASRNTTEKLTVEILDYVSAHFNEDISLATVADALGYSYQHISRVFNQKINTPFKDFLNFYRLEYAKIMLIETDTSIAEVAHESGFQSIRNFNLVCMKLSGKTPREIRCHANDTASI